MSLTAAWPVKRMRFMVKRQPSAEQLRCLSKAQEVSFLPMEAIGENGQIDTSQTRDKETVASGYTQFFDGDVVVAKITPCFENGKGALVRGLLNGVGFGTTELHVLNPAAELYARFLYYFTNSVPFLRQGEAEMTGAAGQKRVPEEFVRDYPVPVLPLSMQRAIADYLDRETARLDALVAAKDRCLELLAEKRRALITRVVTRGIQNRDIPLIRLKWLLDGIDTGFTPDSFAYPAQEGQKGVLRSGCVNGGVFDANENKLLAEDVEAPDSLKVNRGDILMSRASGSSELIGSVAQVTEPPAPALYLSDKTFRLRVKEANCDGAFLVWTMGSTFLRGQISQIISGAEGLAKNIPQSEIRELLIPNPSPPEQRAIVAYISAETAKLDALRAATERTIGLLRERRAALITAAVSGQMPIAGTADLPVV